MAILPGSSLLTFTFGSSSFDTYVDEVSLQYTIETFIRSEFLHERLREVPLTDGTLPIVNRNIANTPHQQILSCSADFARPLGPTTLSNFNSAHQRFNIQRYSIKGAPTLSTNLVQLAVKAFAHRKLLNNFEYHLAKSNGDIGRSNLVSLQDETFSYLTNTSVNMTGASVGGTVSNILIIDFSTSVAYEATDGSGEIIQEWNMTADFRTIESQVN